MFRANIKQPFKKAFPCLHDFLRPLKKRLLKIREVGRDLKPFLETISMLRFEDIDCIEIIFSYTKLLCLLII